MRGVAAFHSKDDNFCHQMAKKRAENSLFFLFQYYCPILNVHIAMQTFIFFNGFIDSF